ncbi:hypothetical protein AKG34_23920 [Peribacillus butanolivorans]|nr:hypothetical protein AKG34_23920 [Peribacillus butanolivorans]
MEWKVRDSCGKSVSKGDPAGAKSAEEAPGPPAESECLTFQSRFEFYKHLKKTVDCPLRAVQLE